MVDAMRSEGYYGAEVPPVLEESTVPVEVCFQVDAGPMYTVEVLELRFPGDEIPVQASELKGKVEEIPADELFY